VSKTVILLNPYGTDVTPYISHTSGYSQLLNGTVAATTDTVYTLPYNNNVSTTANIVSGAGLLDTKLNGTSGQILVFGYSEGCQIADYWLTNYGPTTTVSPANVSFLLIGNANRKYGGFAYNRSVFSSVGYNGGKPDNTPFTVVDFVRQYDPIGDFPTATAIVNALVDLSYVGSDANYISGAFQSVSNVLASTAYSNTMTNVLAGLALIHTGLGVAGTGYMSVTPSDPVNLSLPDGNITWVWSPTYPVPMLGTGGTFPQTDQQLRIQIEQSYTRPVQIPMPDYGNNSGWGVEPFPVAVPPAPVTGWWAELNVSCNIVVTPTVSASTGHIGAALALTVTPLVSVSANAHEFGLISQLVTPSVTVTAALLVSAGVAQTVTPSVSVAAGVVKDVAVTVTVSPSVSVAAEVTNIAIANASVSVTPSVVSAATVLKPAAVAGVVTPSVSSAVNAVGSAAVSVTPTVSVSGSLIILGPTLDAVGPGANNDADASSVTWAHTAASGADLFVYIANPTTTTGYLPTAVTYNGVAMTQIAANDTSHAGYLFLYHLAHAGTGSSENVVATWGNNPFYAVCNSISFNNVAAVGTPGYAQDSGSESTPTQSATLALPGTLILQGFGFHQPAGSVTTSGGTADYSYYDSTSSAALTINHATTTQTFTGSTASTYWAGIDVALFSPLPVAITVTPTVSVSMGASTVVNSAATTVTPSVSATAVVTRAGAVPVTVTPAVTVSAGLTEFATAAITVTPAVSTSATAEISSAITVTPSVASATSDDTSVYATVTPSVSVAAVVYREAAVAATVTPGVSVSGVVTEFASATVTVTPSVGVVGDTVLNIAAALSATPGVSAAGGITESAAATVSVTPSVSVAASTAAAVSVSVSPSVSVVAAVIKPVTVTVTATPTMAVNGATVWRDTVTLSVTPAVTAAMVPVKPGNVAVTATPSVSVAGTVSASLGYNATGAGSSGRSVASISWAHTAASGAYVFVFAAVPAGTGTVSSVTYGGTAMTQLTSKTDNNGNIEYLYSLASAPGGAQTVTVTGSSSSAYLAGNSVSYTGVGSVGTPQTVSVTSGSLTQSVTCTTGQMIVQGFMDWQTNITSASGGTNRSLVNWLGTSGAGVLTISDATASTTFTATGGVPYTGIAVVI
jgi:hypothetical protein